MTLTEPATLITDYMMAALALVWYWRLGGVPAGPFVRYWRLAFLFLALTSLAGGSYHGLQALLGPVVLDIAWRLTLVTAALTSLFLLLAGTGQFGHGHDAGWRWIAGVKALAALIVGQVWPDFTVVLVDSGASLAVVAVLALRGWGWRWDAHGKFLAGVGLFLAGGVVQAMELAPHPAFNHNDLFHLIQIAANGMFYLCAREVHHPGGPKPGLGDD